MTEAGSVERSALPAAVSAPDPLTACLAFLDRIGIAVHLAPVGDDAFLPGLAIRQGMLIVDLRTLRWPGDVLHEAGHIAVTDPEMRPGLDAVASDPAEEMAAIAWSYAAACVIGLDPRALFHDDYAGGGEAILSSFRDGQGIGVPLLGWWGMTGGETTFPAMRRWLR